MKTHALLLISFSFMCATRAGELYIKPQRSSLHLGESITCRVHFTREYARRSQTEWTRGQAFYGEVLSFPFRPTEEGKQNIGPVSITIGNETVAADAVPVDVLPPVGTNNFFEIRVSDTEIEKNQKVEVVVQWQRLKRIPNPYFKAEQNTFPYHLTTLKETDDWTLRAHSGNHCGGPTGEDAKGRYILDGMLEVYHFEPKRTGRLKITKDLFRNLPADYPFRETTITVR